MNTDKTEKEKRRRGRPYAGGREPYIGIRLPPEMLDAVDTFGRAYGIKGRSAAIRALIKRALRRSS